MNTKSDIKTVLARNLRAYKKEKGIDSDRALAEHLRMNQKTLWNLLKGEIDPTMKRLQEIVDATGIPASNWVSTEFSFKRRSSLRQQQPSHYVIDVSLIEYMLEALAEYERTELGGVPLSPRTKAEKIAKFYTLRVQEQHARDRARIEAMISEVIHEGAP